MPDEAIPWSFKYKFDATLGFLVLHAGGKPAHVAQLVEHVLGKDEVTGSIPVMGSRAASKPAADNYGKYDSLVNQEN